MCLKNFPEKFSYLEGYDQIQEEAGEETFDLCICLDCSDRERLGEFSVYLDTARASICVDHHVTNTGYAGENVVEAGASSTAEVLYGQLDQAAVDQRIAACLYTGIIHDTGVFQYSCTSPSTMRAAAELLEKGVDAPRIIRDTYYEKTYAQHQVLGRALLESIMFLDGKCIASYIRAREMKFFGVDRSDLDGIASQLRNTKGVEVAIFMDEITSQCL